MKNIKRLVRVIYTFKPMKHFYPFATRWGTIKWFMARSIRNVSIVVSYAIVATVSAKIYNHYYPIVIKADAQVVHIEVPVTEEIPVLNNIITCESGGKQFGKDGQLNVNINVQADGTKSIDVGIGQINTKVWGSTATKMGYDLAKEVDNKAFTKWLFLTHGSEPWYSSKACWNK